MIRGTIRAVCLSALVCLAACTTAHYSTGVSAPQQNKDIKGITTADSRFYPGTFDRIVVYGPLQVAVTTDSTVKMYRVESAQYLPLSTIASFDMANRTLYIYAIKPPQSSTPNNVALGYLQIAVPQLNAVTAHNGGKIRVDNIQTTHFIVEADGQGVISLNGRATRLDATLQDKTRLDARHLQARTLFVHTSGMAQAEVRNVDGLSVLSTDKSNVYFYTDPAAMADYERQNASTLRMTGIVPPPLIDPDDDQNIK